MKLDDIDRIPDGIGDCNVAPKAILRTAVAIAPALEQRASAMIGALLLLFQGQPDEVALIRAVAEGLQVAARIADRLRPCGLPTCTRCNPPKAGGGLPS